MNQVSYLILAIFMAITFSCDDASVKKGSGRTAGRTTAGDQSGEVGTTGGSAESGEENPFEGSFPTDNPDTDTDDPEASPTPNPQPLVTPPPPKACDVTIQGEGLVHIEHGETYVDIAPPIECNCSDGTASCEYTQEGWGTDQSVCDHPDGFTLAPGSEVTFPKEICGCSATTPLVLSCDATVTDTGPVTCAGRNSGEVLSAGEVKEYSEEICTCYSEGLHCVPKNSPFNPGDGYCTLDGRTWKAGSRAYGFAGGFYCDCMRTSGTYMCLSEGSNQCKRRGVVLSSGETKDISIGSSQKETCQCSGSGAGINLNCDWGDFGS